MIKIYIDPELDFQPKLPKNAAWTDDPAAAELLLTPGKAPAECKGHVIACRNQDAVKHMDKAEIAAYHDIWLLPVIPPLWQARLDKLVEWVSELNTAQIEKSWLETLIDSMPDMIWFKSLDGLHMKVNQAFCKAAGKTRKMIEGRDHYFIWNVDPGSADHDETCVNSEAEVIKANKTCTFNETLKIGDQKRHLLTYKTPIHDRHGKIIGTVGVAHDITNILNLSMEIEIFIEAMPFPIIMHNEKGIITHMNQKFADFFHERKSDIIGVNYWDWKSWFFTHEAGSLGFMDDGEQKFVSVRETELRDIFGNVFGGLAVFSDITAEKNLEITIRRNASEDHLTGLANRHALTEYFQKMDKEVFHLLYLDLDNFKAVNDRWGHETGDMALRKIASVMRETFPNDFLARLGGDEFLVCIARDIEDDELAALAAKVQANLSTWFSSLDKLSDVSLSIGIRPACDPEYPLEQLIHEADQAMYAAKRNGKAQAKVWEP
ncbi:MULTISPECIES: diguanylate cyclase [unclassified Desulfovibrio]|uniref:sensor domain-containing diguanylate cyclase n=1 Tax=unclassified Desulfovibrio TaxID=2593640 RepID=UPI0013E9ADFB|nr:MULTISPECIES: diguanylate cyclase [unclassified Desulfovibrio]